MKSIQLISKSKVKALLKLGGLLPTSRFKSQKPKGRKAVLARLLASDYMQVKSGAA
jgi:hypothetical protein